MLLNINSPAQSGSRLLREAVYEELRADILACKLAPGAEIREGELAARFQVSKSPVRDALMWLEREGLVITLPRQGYRVAPISLSDVLDMFHLREALERACMERIVRRASDEQLQTLERFRRFDPDGWGDGGFIAYNREFHRSLAGLAQNARMRDHLTDLIDQMERAVLMSLSHVNIKKGNPQSLVEEHCRIIDALQARQGKKAERLAERHIAAAGKRVSDALSRMVIAG
jgi:GntR family transcriptional regulator, rspAB operon transcriptional repressor